jgi:serine/threonine protein kinase/tetratricopeptide (TPR) repeat protein
MQTICPVCEAHLSPIPDSHGFIQCPACGLKVPRAAGMGLSCLAPGADLSNLRLEACLPPDLRERFQVETLLGVGGMGTVFRARCLASGRIVAIKLLTAFENPALRARFLREGAVMARLRHANIAQVLEVQTTRRIPYLVCEYLGGGTLKQRILSGGPLPAVVSINVMKAVLSALGSCHEHGIVHRDLKPQNIIFDGDGTPKLTDLGIARDLWDHGAHLTVTGMIIGTPTYMAPEQLRGEPAGVLADIYAAGAVLLEMLSGEPPRGVSSRQAVLARLPGDKTAEMTVRLASIIARCLSVEPAERPASARILARELTRPISTKVPRAVPVAPLAARQPPSKMLGGVIMAGLAVGVSILALLQQAWLSGAEPLRIAANPTSVHAANPPAVPTEQTVPVAAAQRDDAAPLEEEMPSQNNIVLRHISRKPRHLYIAPQAKTPRTVEIYQDPSPTPSGAAIAEGTQPQSNRSPVAASNDTGDSGGAARAPSTESAANGSVPAGGAKGSSAKKAGRIVAATNGSHIRGSSLSSTLETVVTKAARRGKHRAQPPPPVAPPPVAAPPPLAAAPLAAAPSQARLPAAAAPASPPSDECSRPNEWQQDLDRLKSPNMRLSLLRNMEEARDAAARMRAKQAKADDERQKERMAADHTLTLALEANSKSEFLLNGGQPTESRAAAEEGLGLIDQLTAAARGDSARETVLNRARTSLLLIQARADEALGNYDKAVESLEKRIEIPEPPPADGTPASLTQQQLSQYDLANFLSAHDLRPERQVELRQALMQKWEHSGHDRDFGSSRISYACALRKAGREAEADELMAAVRQTKTGQGRTD